MAVQMGFHSLGDLPRLRDCKRKRFSSWDTSGGNADSWPFEKNENKILADIKGAGCIRHIWMTIGSNEEFHPRKCLLRMYWDGEKQPSVEVPVGDFFGVGHGLYREFWSIPLTMSPRDGRAMNCFFPMPFANGARIEFLSECENRLVLYFYIDYEEYSSLEEGIGRFHSQWRRENPTRGWDDDPARRNIPQEESWKVPNLDGVENYLILEAEGKGHYVGCNLNIDQFELQRNDWYGEGDDMIFIDGDPMPTINGTGTEDYFNTAWGPNKEFCTPYHGITLCQHPNYLGKNSLYRFHIEDPIHFGKSIKVTIEHGHANDLSNDYSSTAYWYQTEPHKAFPIMLPVEQRLPRPMNIPRPVKTVEGI
jgi:hypothetical protein